MASRKEQKERLRREREERERKAREAAERRKRLMGFGAGGALVAAVVVVLVVLLASGGGSSGSGSKDTSGTSLPGGGKVPTPRVTDLDAAAKAAGCQLKSFNAKSRDHTQNVNEKVKYDSNPPSEGRHYQIPASDGAYEKSPPVTTLVHSLEHGRTIFWFTPGIPAKARADLKALYDQDPTLLILTPDTTGMPYQVAATAWTAAPQPLGTGRLLGCPLFGPRTLDALRAFEDKYRGNGPEGTGGQPLG